MRVNRSERFGGGVMLAAAVLFSILPLLSMASAALQPRARSPSASSGRPTRSGTTSSTPGTWPRSRRC